MDGFRNRPIHRIHKLRWGPLHRPGPGFMPSLIGSLLVLLGLLLTFLDTRRREKKGEEVSLRKFWGKGVYSLIASFLYIFLLEPLGFVIATLLLFFSLLKIMGTRKWFTPVLISFFRCGSELLHLYCLASN